MTVRSDVIHEGTRYRIKDRQKARIFDIISKTAGISRKRLANRLRLRSSTVSMLANELINQKLVKEGPATNAGRQGRPEIRLTPNFDRLTAISVYVLSREIKGTLLNMNGGVKATESVVVSAEANNAKMVSALVGLVQRLAKENGKGSELLGVGLSLGGCVDLPNKLWLSTARWPNLRNVDLSKAEHRTGLSFQLFRFIESYLEHILLAHAEMNSGGTLLYHWGYGIGAGYALDGKVIRGGLGAFAEVGHWNVFPSSKTRCQCGATGCLETQCALWALLPELTQKYGRVPEDEYEFADFFRSRRLASDRIITRAMKHVASSMANLYMTFYPERILIFGPFLASEALFDSIVENVKLRVPPFARDRVSIEVVSDDIAGEISGSTFPLFRDALKKHLTAS